MRIGAIEVRDALPQGTYHITEKQIKEALWHYYYDVGKSVAYLVSTYLVKERVTSGKKAKGGSISPICSAEMEIGVVKTGKSMGGGSQPRKYH